MKSAVKCLVFDLGGTLVRIDYGTWFRAVARLTGEGADQLLERAEESGLGRDFDQGLIEPPIFVRRVQSLFSFDLDEKEIRTLWNSIFDRDPAMEELLERLARRYPLVMLSNVNPWHFEHLNRSAPFFKLFKGFVLSYREKRMKPDPLIYAKAAELGGSDPTECVFVDDVQSYVDGAAKAGMKAVRFRGRDRLVDDLRALGVVWS